LQSIHSLSGKAITVPRRYLSRHQEEQRVPCNSLSSNFEGVRQGSGKLDRRVNANFLPILPGPREPVLDATYPSLQFNRIHHPFLRSLVDFCLSPGFRFAWNLVRCLRVLLHYAYLEKTFETLKLGAPNSFITHEGRVRDLCVLRRMLIGHGLNAKKFKRICICSQKISVII
jgi:hypothetical protein